MPANAVPPTALEANRVPASPRGVTASPLHGSAQLRNMACRPLRVEHTDERVGAVRQRVDGQAHLRVFEKVFPIDLQKLPKKLPIGPLD